jgi:hypothetical protein
MLKIKDNKIEIRFYRHKIYKNIYLKKNNYIYGGSSNAAWFAATTDLLEALNSFKNKDVVTEYKNHFYSDGHSELKAKIILEKEIDFDGYKGVLKKEAIYPLDDFELITLVEKVEDK